MIEANKELKLNNILSLRKRMKQEEVEKEMHKITRYMQENGLKKAGPLITTTFSIENANGEQILDMEILVPVSKGIKLLGEYQFKEEFRLLNAVYARHEGNPYNLQETYNKLMEYIQKNNLVQITSAYNVNIKQPSLVENIEDTIIDVYIGVSPNML